MQKTKQMKLKSWAAVMLACSAVTLSGCALGTLSTATETSPVVGPATQGAAMKGRVNGGQNPVSGAHVYLFAAGNSATAHNYGTGATSLLSSNVLTNNTAATDASSYTGVGGTDGTNFYVATDSAGAFSISNDYTCPGAVTQNGVTYPAQVYLMVVGGDSGSGNNPKSNLLAALGPCTSASALAAAVPFVVVNEVTTVAAVWSLQQFMGAPSGAAGSVNIGAPTTNLVGLQNAFTMAANLANIGTGQPSTLNPVATPESDRVSTIADILAYCVNSVAGTSSCDNLFASVTPSAGALSTKGVAAGTLNTPADTVQAAWYMAQFPTNIGGTGSCGTAASAYACIQGVGAPFTAMTTSPTDWTLAVGYTPTSNGTPALYNPYALVMDRFGNAWVDSVGSVESVVPLAPNGQAIYAPVTQYTVGANSAYAATLSGNTSAVAYMRSISHARALTIDSNGNVWLADSNGASPSSNETAINAPACTGSSVCYFGTVAEFPAATGPGAADPSGVKGYYTPSFPTGAGSDASGNVYFSFAGGSTNYGSKSTGKISSAGVFTAGQGLGTHGYGVAVDDNTAATNGPLIWSNSTAGCTASAGGNASVIFQQTSAMAATTTSGLTGANTGCTSSVHDKIVASTGLVVGLSFDASNNLWMVNGATDILGAFSGTGNALNTVTYGVVTVASGKASVSTTDSTKSIMSSANFAGMNNPQFSEVDGAGNLWVANYGASSVSEISVSNAGTASMALNALSGTSGFQHAETGSGLTNSESVGIDLSGNVWVTNSGSSSFTPQYVTVLVGAATPVGPVVPGNLGVAP